MKIMKPLSLFAVAGSLMALLPGSSRAQDMFTLEDHIPNIAQSILVSPTITAASPSIRFATLSQSNVGPGQPNDVAGFEYADNNGSGVISYGTNLNNIVITDSQDATSLDTLTLTFAQPVETLNFNFAVIFVSGPTVTISATTDNAAIFNSGVGVFNATTMDNEGTLTLTSPTPGGAFSVLNIFLSGTATIGDTFAVDNFVATPSITQVPEPGSIALLLGIGLPLAWKLRRKARQR